MEAINEVKSTIKAETYGVDPNDTLVTPLLLSPVKIDVKETTMDMGTLEFDHVLHEFGTLTMDLSKLALAKFYVVQHAATTKIRI